jgi:hypothetical protein
VADPRLALPPFLSAPLFFRLPLHCWGVRVLQLQPVSRPPRPIGRTKPLAHDVVQCRRQLTTSSQPINHFGNPQREKYQDDRRIDHWSGIKLKEARALAVSGQTVAAFDVKLKRSTLSAGAASSQPPAASAGMFETKVPALSAPPQTGSGAFSFCVAAVSAAAYRPRRTSRLHRAQKTPSQKRLDPPPKQRLRRTAIGRRAKRRRATWHSFPPPIRKGQRPGCPLLCARVDGLEPLLLAFHASGRQAIFLGATEPHAARPKEKPRGATHLVGQGCLAVSTNW